MLSRHDIFILSCFHTILWVTDGTRTRNVQNHNLVLYQLSYSHHLSGRWGSNPRKTTPLCPHWLPRPVASTTRSLPVVCRGSGTRTHDPLVPNQIRYQLRYTPYNLFTLTNGQDSCLQICYHSRII